MFIKPVHTLVVAALELWAPLGFLPVGSSPMDVRTTGPQMTDGVRATGLSLGTAPIVLTPKVDGRRLVPSLTTQAVLV